MDSLEIRNGHLFLCSNGDPVQGVGEPFERDPGYDQPPDFKPWQCEKCGRYHDRLCPKEGCEWCKGENIARRMGLKSA